MAGMTRRDLLSTAALVGGWYMLGSEQAPAQDTPLSGATPTDGPYTLPDLPYSFSDLEPHIDSQTMKLHHDIHHAGYVRNANEAVAELESVRRIGGEQIRRVRAITDSLSFNLSGHLLHSLYWTSMSRSGGGEPKAECDIARLLKRDFGSVEAFRGHFQAAAQQVQGSGWGVLAFEPASERLIVLQAEKHQNTAVWGVVPLLVLDVWEHAYYLLYQNQRSSYIKAFMNVVDWDSADRRLRKAIGKE